MLFHEQDLRTGRLICRRIEQVIAPLLIINRVANQSALTGNTVVAPQIGSFTFKRGGESMGSGAPPGGYPLGLGDNYGKNNSELGIGIATTINLPEESRV